MSLRLCSDTLQSSSLLASLLYCFQGNGAQRTRAYKQWKMGGAEFIGNSLAILSRKVRLALLKQIQVELYILKIALKQNIFNYHIDFLYNLRAYIVMNI